MPAEHDAALRALPSVEKVLASPVLAGGAGVDRPLLAELVRDEIQARRDALRAGKTVRADLETVARGALDRAERFLTPSYRRVLNATGIVLHTNLGRAPLSEDARNAVLAAATGYSNLEIDLATGKRSRRIAHVLPLLRTLTGAGDALVVNNNAAAVLLALNSLAEGREVIVSRGELIEIGGSFRLPEIMQKSGARLVEVGTTNRTHPEDYDRAITERTALLLKVHWSNFRMEGFVSEVPLERLVEIGKARGVPVMEDLGSGALVDLEPFGLPREPIVRDRLALGVDLVTVSGDKLLGGPQCGILAGDEAAIARISRNPLVRAVRLDKLSLAALEATLRAYLRGPDAARSLPALRMLSEPKASLAARAEELRAALAARVPSVRVSVEEGAGEAGGGALPDVPLATPLVVVDPSPVAPDVLAARLRRESPPLVARIREDRILLDLRTLAPEEAREVPSLFARALGHEGARKGD